MSGNILTSAPPALQWLASDAKAEPTPSERLTTAALQIVYERDPPGTKLGTVYEQTNHNRGAIAIVTKAYMDAIGAAKFSVLEKKIAARFLKSGSADTGHYSRDDQYEPADDDCPLCHVVENPGGEDGVWSMHQECTYLTLQHILTGDAPAWTPHNDKGRPARFFGLTSALVNPLPGVSQQYPKGAYLVTPYGGGSAFYLGGTLAAAARLPGEEVARFREMHPWSRALGYSRLQAGAKEIDVLESITESRYSYFDGGLNLSGFALLPGAGQDTIESFKKQLEERHGGSKNHRRVLVLAGEAGMDKNWKFEPNMPTGVEMDYIQSYEQAAGIVLALFRVTKGVAGFTEFSSYAQLYAELKQWYELGIIPYCRALSVFLTQALAKPWSERPGQYRIEVEPAPLQNLEALQKDREFAVQNDLMTVNEWRKANNMKPFPDGDVAPSAWKAKQAPQPAPKPPGANPFAPTPSLDAPTAGAPPQPENPDSEGSLPPRPQKALKGFDPNEKRDESGKWTEGGASGESKPPAPHTMSREKFAKEHGSKQEAFDEALAMALTVPNSVHSQMIHGNEKPIEEVRDFHSQQYPNGKVQKWALRKYEGRDGRIRYVAIPYNRDGTKLYDDGQNMLVEGGVQVEPQKDGPPKILTAAVSPDAKGAGLVKAIIKHIEKEYGDWEPSYPMSQQGAKLVHRMKVEQSLSKGEPVSAEALADYPDLAAKYPHAKQKALECGMSEQAVSTGGALVPPVNRLKRKRKRLGAIAQKVLKALEG